MTPRAALVRAILGLPSTSAVVGADRAVSFPGFRHGLWPLNFRCGRDADREVEHDVLVTRRLYARCILSFPFCEESFFPLFRRVFQRIPT